MKIGRNFTNLLEIDYLSPDQLQDLKTGKIDVSDMDFITQNQVKADIVHQIKTAAEFGVQHIELDGAVPNPYLYMTDAQKKEIFDAGKDNNVSISLHLPYTYVAQSVCAFQETDRQIACDLQKRYIDFAHDIGAIALNMHPGSVPYYQTGEHYKAGLWENLKKSLIELASYAAKFNLKFHLENNTAYDIIFVAPEDGIKIVQDVRAEGIDNIYYNLDIGHWFTIINNGGVVPEPPEKVIEKIPSDIIYELHLNDYVPKTGRFHPPLHWQSGLLKKENIRNYFKIVKSKNVQLVLLETAIRKNEEALSSKQILKEEDEYIMQLFEEA